MKSAKRIYLQILLIFLTLMLVFPGTAWAQGTELDEVRYLLRNLYVDPVPEEILNYPSIDEILAHLNDPYTTFMSASQYNDFKNDLNQCYVGIGMYIDLTDAGFVVSGVISGSPAEKLGLQAGDIIIAIDNHSIKGMSPEEVDPLLKGPAGSWINLTYQRDDQVFTIQAERESITIPAVTSEIGPYNTAYLDISTFSSDTGALFAQSLTKVLIQNPNSYIIDLRDNGGGYIDQALDIAGYFIGDNLAVQLYHRDLPAYPLQAVKHNTMIDKPTIFIVNHNTASASEALTMAVRDYNKALIVGDQTYGKGCGQQIFPLDGGDYFKMTTTYLKPPLSKSINKTGITPDLVIEKTDPLKATLLLLSGSDTNLNGDVVKLNLAAKSVYIDTKQARDADYWQAYGEILDKAGSGIMIGKAGNWEGITPKPLSDRRSLYYPDYKLGNDTVGTIVNNALTVHFPQKVDQDSLNQANIELIASNSGDRIPLALTPEEDGNAIKVTAMKDLLPDITYWLVLHPGIQDRNDLAGQPGAVFALTVQSSGANGTGVESGSILNM